MIVRTLASALLVLACSSALADVDLYFDRTDFRNAASGPLVTEDFESFSTDTPFDSSSPLVLANGVTLTADDPGPKIDALPHDNDESNVNGTTSIRANNFDVTTILFEPPVSAWGADFSEFQDEADRTTIEFYLDGAPVDGWTPAQVPVGTVRFLGFVGQGDTVFDEVRFVVNEEWDVFGIDDMEFSGRAAPVPVPAMGNLGLALLIGVMGLFGFAAVRRVV